MVKSSLLAPLLVCTASHKHEADVLMQVFNKGSIEKQIGAKAVVDEGQAFVKKGSATIGAIDDTNLGSATIGHTTKLEAALEASLMQVVSGEASVATLPTADVLDGITNDMTSIQEEVDCCGPEPSTGCTSTVTGCTTKGLAVAALDSIKSAEQAVKDALVVDFADCCTPTETMLVAAQTAHSTCRGEQKTTQTAVVTNCGSSSDLATTGKTVHTKVELAGNCGDTSNAGGTVMMDKLVSFKALYDDYYEQLYFAKEACSTATDNHGTADPPVGKVAECNGKQRSFEMISCERQTALDQYCTDRLNNYNTVKQTADTKRKPEEDHLQGLWGSAYRVKCFIDLVKAVGLDGSAGGTCDWSIDISRSDHGPDEVWKTINVTGPADDVFTFDGCTTAGAEGERCVNEIKVKSGVRTLKNKAGDIVDTGICCNGQFNKVIRAVRGACTGGHPGNGDNITKAEVTGCATETIPFPAQLTFVYTDTSTFGTFACAGTDTHISPDESGFEEHYYNGLAGTKTPQSCTTPDDDDFDGTNYDYFDGTTTTTSMAPMPDPAMSCIKIKTGISQSAGGYLQVKINDVLEVNGVYELGSNVLTKCYVAITSLFVGGAPSETDAWVGSISHSPDGGSTWNTMTCINCTKGSSTTKISVDGDTSSPEAPTQCLSGQSCQIV